MQIPKLNVSEWRIEDIVNAIGFYIAPVLDFYDGDSDQPLIYFFPDSHPHDDRDAKEEIARCQVKGIDRLNSLIGVKLVGLEAIWEGVIDDRVIERFALEKECTPEQIIEANPLLGFVYSDDRVLGTGLENKDAYLAVKNIPALEMALNSVINTYNDCLRKTNGNGFVMYCAFVSAFKREVEPIIKDFAYKDKLPTMPAFIDRVEFVSVFNRFRTEYNRIFREYADRRRSNIASGLPVQRCMSMRESQIVVVFGGGHGGGMKKVWEEYKIPYITISTFDYNRKKGRVSCRVKE